MPPDAELLKSERRLSESAVSTSMSLDTGVLRRSSLPRAVGNNEKTLSLNKFAHMQLVKACIRGDSECLESILRTQGGLNLSYKGMPNYSHTSRLQRLLSVALRSNVWSCRHY